MSEVKVGDRGVWASLPVRVLAIDGPNLWVITARGVRHDIPAEQFTPSPRFPETVMVEISLEDARTMAETFLVAYQKSPDFYLTRIYGACAAALRREGL